MTERGLSSDLVIIQGMRTKLRIRNSTGRVNTKRTSNKKGTIEPPPCPVGLARWIVSLGGT